MHDNEENCVHLQWQWMTDTSAAGVKKNSEFSRLEKDKKSSKRWDPLIDTSTLWSPENYHVRNLRRRITIDADGAVQYSRTRQCQPGIFYLRYNSAKRPTSIKISVRRKFIYPFKRRF